jgi:amino acid permease
VAGAMFIGFLGIPVLLVMVDVYLGYRVSKLNKQKKNSVQLTFLFIVCLILTIIVGVWVYSLLTSDIGP